MRQQKTLCLVGIVLTATLFSSCSKEAMDPAPMPKPVLGERYDPQVEDVMPLILDLEERKMAYAQGARSEPGEVILQEAIWLAEALMNYQKGDASRYGDGWITGTVDYSFPITVKPDGSVWLNEADLYVSYDAAMAQINEAVGEGKVYTLDHELLGVTNGIATMRIEWSDKDPTSAIGVPYLPSGSGCHDADDGATILTSLLHWNFHQLAAELPAFYVTLWPQQPPGAWFDIWDNDPVIPNDFGYTGYFGTNEAQGGAGLIFNSNVFSNSVCFPAQWDKLVIARDIVIQQRQIASPIVFTRERVVYENYYVGSTGIAQYPQGQHHHKYEYKLGRLVRGPL